MDTSNKEADLAHIDWLAFTVRTNDIDLSLRELRTFLSIEFHIPADDWEATGSGWNGYRTRINLGSYGLLAYGGNSQQNTIHIEINGQGCALIPDWKKIHDHAEVNGWVITRVDLAYDDFEAKTIDIDRCIQWFKEGLFNSNGRPPKARLIDDFNSGDGKTLYIGSRKNGKLGRFYEKGREQGDPNSPWFRAEVELRKKDRIIPWDILLSSGAYLAATYKALEFISIRQCKLKTIQKASTISYEAMVKWLHTAAGKSLNAMTQVEQGDISAVFEQVVRDGLPARLQPFSDHIPESINQD